MDAQKEQPQNNFFIKGLIPGLVVGSILGWWWSTFIIIFVIGHEYSIPGIVYIAGQSIDNCREVVKQLKFKAGIIPPPIEEASTNSEKTPAQPSIAQTSATEVAQTSIFTPAGLYQNSGNLFSPTTFANLATTFAQHQR